MCQLILHVYLDFQKAFDKVSHGKLVVKMMRAGLDERVVRCIGIIGYLTGDSGLSSMEWYLDGIRLRVVFPRDPCWGQCYHLH